MTHNPHRHHELRLRAPLMVLAPLIVVALTATACASGSSPHASLAGTSSTVTSATGTGPAQTGSSSAVAGGASAPAGSTPSATSPAGQLTQSTTPTAAPPAAPSSGLEFDSPSGLIVSAGHLWVTNLNGNSVTEIDPASGSWIRTFRGAGYDFNQPTAIAAYGADLFVTNAAGWVSELNASTGAAVRVINGSQYGFADPVALTVVGSTVVVLSEGRSSTAGSITEIDATTGNLVRTAAGGSYALDQAVALTASGSDLFIADKGNSAVTEVDATNGALVRVIRGSGLSGTDGIAVNAGYVWASDSASNAVTKINPATGSVVTTVGDSDGDYGFGSPSVAIAAAGSVFIATPFGSSPMVTKVLPNDKPSWYMCNTNGPYYFSLLSALTASGNDIWVASRSGANSATPGAKTGSLTELSATSGALMRTLPTS